MTDGDFRITMAGQGTGTTHAPHGFDGFIQGDQDLAGYRFTSYDDCGNVPLITVEELRLNRKRKCFQRAASLLTASPADQPRFKNLSRTY